MSGARGRLIIIATTTTMSWTPGLNGRSLATIIKMGFTLPDRTLLEENTWYTYLPTYKGLYIWSKSKMIIRKVASPSLGSEQELGPRSDIATR